MPATDQPEGEQFLTLTSPMKSTPLYPKWIILSSQQYRNEYLRLHKYNFHGFETKISAEAEHFTAEKSTFNVPCWINWRNGRTLHSSM